MAPLYKATLSIYHSGNFPPKTIDGFILNILAVETSSEACSAALLTDGSLEERFEIAPRGHGDLILKMVDELMSEAALKPAQLSAVAFGRGPGAFTGVRIATSVVQGIALGADLPVVPVSTLAALAQGACREHGEHNYLCAIDARMGEIYWGAYDAKDGIVNALYEDTICKPEAAPVVEGKDWFAVGNGWQAFGEPLAQHYKGQVVNTSMALPRALDVAVLAKCYFADGKSVSPEQALPVYLRDDVVSR